MVRGEAAQNLWRVQPEQRQCEIPVTVARVHREPHMGRSAAEDQVMVRQGWESYAEVRRAALSHMPSQGRARRQLKEATALAEACWRKCRTPSWAHYCALWT